jgi:hypothetical protein
MMIRLIPVTLGTSPGSRDDNGRLLYVGEHLVAVIVQLSSEHAALEGRWYIEAGFGVTECRETFMTLEDATQWTMRHKAS